MVWTCPSCSRSPSLIRNILEGVAQIKDTNKELQELLVSLKDDLHKEKEKRINTEQEIYMLRGQFKELVDELSKVANKGLLGTSAHPDPYSKKINPTPSMSDVVKTNKNAVPTKTVTPPTPPEPSKTLLIGTSLLRNVNPTKLKDCEVLCKGGAKLDDISKMLSAMDSTKKYKEIIVVAGSIDVESGNVPDVKNAFQVLSVCAQDKTDKVRISSVLPRTDLDVKETTKSLNDALKSMCDLEGHGFIDHDPSFYLMNGKVNGALLLQDGLHLTQAGVESLVANCGISTQGSPYTPKRYSKPSPKVLFRGHENPLSNFYPVKGLKHKGNYFNSSEAAYQFEKAKQMGNEKMANRILNAKTGIKAMNLGSKVKSNEEWQTQKAKVMESVIHAKLSVCKDARDSLLKSGNSEIIEDTGHPFWARGQDGKGLNMMGKILMMFRRKMSENPMMFKETTSINYTNTGRRWASRDYQPRCFKCGEEGHIQDKCRHGMEVCCWTCGRSGHEQKHCHVRSQTNHYYQY